MSRRKNFYCMKKHSDHVGNKTREIWIDFNSETFQFSSSSTNLKLVGHKLAGCAVVASKFEPFVGNFLITSYNR